MVLHSCGRVGRRRLFKSPDSSESGLFVSLYPMKTLLPFFFFFLSSFIAFGQKTKNEVSRFQYNINTQISTPQEVDSSLTGSQSHHPLFSSFSSWSDLGNTGLPALFNKYRPVRDALNPLIFQGIDGYGVTNDNLIFTATNNPFSLLNYNSGGTADKNGQTIKALFARNLRNNGNISFLGNYYNSEGHFNKQTCNSSVIHFNYILNRKNYKLVTGIARNSFKFSENGGLKSDSELGLYLPSTLSVNLNNASSQISVFTLKGSQSGSINFKRKSSNQVPPTDSALLENNVDSLSNVTPIRLVHVFRVSKVSRRYSDASSDAGFYMNTYSSDKISKDSMSFFSFANDVSLLSDTISIGRFPLLFKAGVNPDFYHYQYADSVSNSLSIGINGKITKVNESGKMELEGRWIAAGYPAGDYRLQGTYSLNHGQANEGPLLEVRAFLRGCSPDPVIRNYLSNHFKWYNDFNRQHESGISLNWKISKIKTDIEASIIGNKGWIYFDSIGMPAQFNDRMTVFSIHGQKKFVAGVFRSSISGLVQYSTSDKIRLPLFVGSTSTYMHHDISFPKTGGSIQVEYGIDLNYSTGFFGYAYMPATGIFYLENEKKLGNYPLLNVFAQMKVKRTRVFVQWCQTFSDILSDQSFAVLHYPSMRPHLKYGIYWHFYD